MKRNLSLRIAILGVEKKERKEKIERNSNWNWISTEIFLFAAYTFLGKIPMYTIHYIIISFCAAYNFKRIDESCMQWMRVGENILMWIGNERWIKLIFNSAFLQFFGKLTFN